MLPRPYVGITGFMNRWEIMELQDRVDPRLFANRDLMVGLLVSSKTLAGLPNRWPARFPLVEDIPDIFFAHPNCLNLIHYHTSDTNNLANELKQVMLFSGPDCHGLQLNIYWPDINELKNFHAAYPKARVVLQLGHRVLEDADWNADIIIERLKPYVHQELINDILIDPSGGLGIAQNDLKSIDEFLGKLFCCEIDIGIGYAGGLCAERLPRIQPLIDNYNHLSLDAENQVRTPIDDKTSNILDAYRAYAYLVSALAMFSPDASL